MRHDIDSTAALETCIGKLPGPRDLKVIDHLDAHAIHWLAATPLLFSAFGDDRGITIRAAGGMKALHVHSTRSSSGFRWRRSMPPTISPASHRASVR